MKLLSVEEEDLLNLEDDEETPILAAVSTYMRRDLNRSEGFFKNILPRYSIDEFKGHFRMTQASLEALCRHVQASLLWEASNSLGKTIFGICMVHCQLGSNMFGVRQV